MTVDAHHHFWTANPHVPVDGDFGPGDLAPGLAAAGVDTTILVQAVNEPAENDRLAAHADEVHFVAGVVGWLPLTDPAAARREHARARTPLWSGFRCLVGRDPIDRLAAPERLALFRDLAADRLVWDVVPVTPEQADSVLRIARAVPELRIVIDHLGRPPVDSDRWEPWASQIAALARCPGVAVKVSVGIDLLTTWVWDVEGLTRYVDWVGVHFGPDRMMLASNWPVVTKRRDYAAAWHDLTAAVRGTGIDGADLAEVLGGTAGRWYG